MSEIPSTLYVVSEFVDYDSSRVEGLFTRIEDAEEWVLDHAATWDGQFQRTTFEGAVSFHSQRHGVGYLIEPFEVDQLVTKKQKKAARKEGRSGRNS